MDAPTPEEMEEIEALSALCLKALFLETPGYSRKIVYCTAMSILGSSLLLLSDGSSEEEAEALRAKALYDFRLVIKALEMGATTDHLSKDQGSRARTDEEPSSTQ